MQLDQLSLRISDADLRDFMSHLPLRDVPVEDLVIAITREGLVVTGKYRQKFKLGFEALVRAVANRDTVTVELADLKAVGPLGGIFRGVITRILASKLGRYAGVTASPGGVTVQANTLLNSLGLKSRVKEIRCRTAEGELKIDCSGVIVLADAERLKSRPTQTWQT